jgi:anti-anti-sigma factor
VGRSVNGAGAGDRRGGPSDIVIEFEVKAREGDHVLLELKGDLAGRVMTDRLKAVLEEHYVDDGVRRIRVDVSPVRFMDSYGVATLVGLLRESHARGKQFVVEGASGQVREKLRVTGVLGILEQG